MPYKCVCDGKSGCDTCLHDYCGNAFCMNEPCPLMLELEYPEGAELCDNCGWEEKHG